MKDMSTIKIIKGDITKIEADCIVNAANKYLGEGGGVCGAIFKAAGREKLAEACDAIGGCRTGDAVITPAFNIKNAKYIIHAVGPRYYEEIADKCERKLYGAYKHSLERMLENGCRSIAFPLISSGIFGYPVPDAWRVAIRSCTDFISSHKEKDITIVFAVFGQSCFGEGVAVLEEFSTHILHGISENVLPMRQWKNDDWVGHRYISTGHPLYHVLRKEEQKIGRKLSLAEIKERVADWDAQFASISDERELLI